MRKSFPLDRTGRLRCDIVEDSVDAFDLGGDAGADLMENCIGDLLDGCGHSVLGVYGADDSGPALKAAFVLNADRLDIGDNYEILPYLLCKSADSEFLAEDRVCLAECVETVAGDRAETAYAESGAGEGLTVNHFVGKSECLADYSYFILEEKLYGLAKLKLKILGKSTYVVCDLTAILPSACFTLSRISG